VLGGADIFVPDSIEVDAAGIFILAGIDEHGTARAPRPGDPTVKLRGFAVIGAANLYRVPPEMLNRRSGRSARASRASTARATSGSAKSGTHGADNSAKAGQGVKQDSTDAAPSSTERSRSLAAPACACTTRLATVPGRPDKKQAPRRRAHASSDLPFARPRQASRTRNRQQASPELRIFRNQAFHPERKAHHPLGERGRQPGPPGHPRLGRQGPAPGPRGRSGR
jgi:hypothetical protein